MNKSVWNELKGIVKVTLLYWKRTIIEIFDAILQHFGLFQTFLWVSLLVYMLGVVSGIYGIKFILGL
jgi:hypothetical protein